MQYAITELDPDDKNPMTDAGESPGMVRGAGALKGAPQVQFGVSRPIVLRSAYQHCENGICYTK